MLLFCASNKREKKRRRSEQKWSDIFRYILVLSAQVLQYFFFSIVFSINLYWHSWYEKRKLNVLMRAVFTFYLLSLLNAIINDELRWNSIECVLKSKTACLFVFFFLFSPLDFTKSRFVFFFMFYFFRCVFSFATELKLVDLCQCISFFGRCKSIASDSNRKKDKTREYYIYLSFSFNYYTESKICVLNSQHQLLCAFFLLRQVFLIDKCNNFIGLPDTKVDRREKAN